MTNILMSAQSILFAGCDGSCSKPGFDPATCKTEACPMNPSETAISIASGDTCEISTQAKSDIQSEESEPKQGFISKFVESFLAFFKGVFQDLRWLFSERPDKA